MTRLRLLLVMFTLLPALAGCGKEETRASAPSLGTGDLRWAAFPVEVLADPKLLSSPDAEEDLLDAMAFWEVRAEKALFLYRGPWQQNGLPYSGSPGDPTEIFANVILFQSPWPFEANIAGKTVIRPNRTGIQSAIILLNAETALCAHDCLNDPGKTSRKKLLAHELGHFIGFGHSPNVNDIMYPEILPFGNLNVLSVDQSLLGRLTK